MGGGFHGNSGIPRVPADGKVMDEANMSSVPLFHLKSWTNKKLQLFPKTADDVSFSIKVTQMCICKDYFQQWTNPYLVLQRVFVGAGQCVGVRQN